MRTNQLMNQCRGELLRKKKSIIQKLQSTKISILDTIKTDPRLWDEECFNFNLNSQATLLLKADISVQDPAQRARNRELEEKAKRKAKEKDDRAKSIEIFVKINDGKTIFLEVQLSDTIRDLKNQVQCMAGIAPDRQCLSYFGKPLRDEITLYDYNINKGRTIELVRRPPLIRISIFRRGNIFHFCFKWFKNPVSDDPK